MKADSISRLREIARRAVLARRRPMLLRGVACGTNPEPEPEPEPDPNPNPDPDPDPNPTPDPKPKPKPNQESSEIVAQHHAWLGAYLLHRKKEVVLKHELKGKQAR